ncbi:MAG: class IV adenylate cyclase [Deltaproteobacteria bacterium]|nr:class IV adenylate cyclase [Deltaproteobacteria bacterium]
MPLFEDGANEATVKNIEAKFRYGDIAAIERKTRKLGARDMGLLHQCDTFFQAEHARLKLREFGDGRGELISYRRSDVPGGRESEYFVYHSTALEGLKAILEQALGTKGSVRKTRHLFLFRNTRIHLDDVEGLGTFVEIETVISGQDRADTVAEFEEVARILKLNPEDSVPVSYFDLLNGSGA